MSRAFFAGRFALVVLTAPVGAVAQGVSLPEGSTVRIWSTSVRRAPVTLERVSADTLIVRDRFGLERVPLSLVQRVDVKIPRSRGQGAVHGAGMGALVGAAAGALVFGYVMGSCQPQDDLCGLAVFAIPEGAVLGLPVGAIIGTMAPGRRWKRAGP